MKDQASDGEAGSQRTFSVWRYANETALSIADVTDKENPEPIATATYPDVAYLHQGWVSDDHRYCGGTLLLEDAKALS